MLFVIKVTQIDEKINVTNQTPMETIVENKISHNLFWLKLISWFVFIYKNNDNHFYYFVFLSLYASSFLLKNISIWT